MQEKCTVSGFYSHSPYRGDDLEGMKRNTLNFIVFSFRRTRTKRPALELMGLGGEKKNSEMQKPEARKFISCHSRAVVSRILLREAFSICIQRNYKFRRLDIRIFSLDWRLCLISMTFRTAELCLHVALLRNPSGNRQSFCRHDKLCFALLALRKTVSAFNFWFIWSIFPASRLF